MHENASYALLPDCCSVSEVIPPITISDIGQHNKIGGKILEMTLAVILFFFFCLLINQIVKDLKRYKFKPNKPCDLFAYLCTIAQVFLLYYSSHTKILFCSRL